MAVILAESFDPYAVMADVTNSGWSQVSGSSFALSSTTPYSVGQCMTLQFASILATTFTSGTNETTVYGSLRTKNAMGAAAYGYISFNDAGTAQCTIRFNTDGSVGLYSGGPTGTLLQTYTGIFTATLWNSFQFKVVINNSTGSIEIRANGATSDTINKTSANTRAGTANSYVNGITIGCTNSSGAFSVDDLLLNNTSGNNPITWPGDIRALQQIPTTVVTPNFSLSPTTTSVTIAANSTTVSTASGAVFYERFTASNTGTISSVIFTLNAGITGNVKVAIYDSTGSGSAPGTPLGTSNAVNNPTTGANTATFGTPISVVDGVNYYVAYDQDTTTVYRGGSLTNSYSGTTAYGSFPATNPGGLTGPSSLQTQVTTLTITNNNSSGIYDLTQDGDTSYIYTSSVVEDKYNLSAISTSYAVTAVQYYVMWRKTDSGSRTAQLSVTANGSSDTAEITNSTISNSYVYQFKTLEQDPTGAYWTPTTVNGALLGIAVTA